MGQEFNICRIGLNDEEASGSWVGLVFDRLRDLVMVWQWASQLGLKFRFVN